MKGSRLIIVFFTISLALLQACGIYSFTGASIPPGAKTVSVEYFKNNANVFNPTLSQELTEKLQDKLTSQTSLNLAESNGDLQFKGEIIDYRSTPVSLVSNETAAYSRLTIKVKVEFINQLDETLNFNETFTRHADYLSTKNLTEVEPVIVPEIIELLTDDIFNKAVVNW